MAEPHWTSYVGMLTGIVGIGVALFSNWKVNKIKSLDLRIELKKLALNTQSNLEQLEELMELANRSRINMSAALGRTGSGQMVKWKDDYQKDILIKDDLLKRAPDITKKYLNLTPHELEDNLIELHDYAGKVIYLCDKYKQTIKKDEEDGIQLKEDFRVSRQLRNNS
jgi:hypothetical protein